MSGWGRGRAAASVKIGVQENNRFLLHVDFKVDWLGKGPLFLYVTLKVSSRTTHLSRILGMQPPRPQRQRLQLHRRGSDIGPECHGPDDHAQDIRNVIPIDSNVARAASLDAAMLFHFCDAGKGGGDGGGGCFERGGRRGAGSDGEGVDELEDEEAGESAAEVGDAMGGQEPVGEGRGRKGGKLGVWAYVARRVM